jgi:hypothetical protein
MGIKHIKTCDLSQKDISDKNPVVVKVNRDFQMEVLGKKIHSDQLECLVSREGLLEAMGLPEYSELMRLIKNDNAAREKFRTSGDGYL